MMKDEEAIVRSDVDGFMRKRIATVKDDRVGCAIVDAPPVVTGGQVRVVELSCRPAARKRDVRASEAEPNRRPNRRERSAGRPL